MMLKEFWGIKLMEGYREILIIDIKYQLKDV